jgi:hypothetical protein
MAARSKSHSGVQIQIGFPGIHRIGLPLPLRNPTHLTMGPGFQMMPIRQLPVLILDFMKNRGTTLKGRNLFGELPQTSHSFVFILKIAAKQPRAVNFLLEQHPMQLQFLAKESLKLFTGFGADFNAQFDHDLVLTKVWCNPRASFPTPGTDRLKTLENAATRAYPTGQMVGTHSPKKRFAFSKKVSDIGLDGSPLSSANCSSALRCSPVSFFGTSITTLMS